MSVRRLQGVALILSAITSLIGFLGGDTPLFNAITVISVILFIVGIPAVYTAQPLGSLGLVGIVLVVIAALIALGFRLLDLNLATSIQSILIWTSILAGAAGRVIVGWLTTRHRVFPAWVGWAFLVEGLLVLLGGFDLGAFTNTFVVIITLVGALALLGYGFYLLRQPQPASAMS